jgi:hypothetical protein
MTKVADRPAFSGRRTNLALLTVLVAAFISGLVAQALGAASTRWVLVIHGVFGITVLLISPWKARVVDRGLGRRNRGRALSLVLALLAIVVLMTGVVHTTGLMTRVGPVTVLWLHVGSALGLIPILIWHYVARKTYPRRVDLSRRSLLRLGGMVSASWGMWLLADRAITAFGLRGGERRFTGSHELSSFVPAGVPVTSWLDDRTPDVDADAWRLELTDDTGSRSLTLAELLALPRKSFVASLDCTSGWWSAQVWEGTTVASLIDAAQARSIVVRSLTGYSRSYPASYAEQLWVVTGMGGKPLSPGHGFPARIVSSDQRGFWWVKWVTAIETSDVPWWLQPPYPLT